MANETIRPGYTYKDDTTTNDYSGNRVELKGASTVLKIINDSGNALDFALNREEDATKIDGVVPANSELELKGLNQGFSSVALKSTVPASHATYRLWAYS